MAERLEIKLSAGQRVYCISLGQSSRMPSAFYSAASVLGLRVSKFVHAPFKSGVTHFANEM